MSSSSIPATYADMVRDFDHAQLAALPAYAALRQALSDLANQGEAMDLATWLAAVADMASTTPYGDVCQQCTPRSSRIWWPYALRRDSGKLTGTYRCGGGHNWTCTWTAS